jgi:hypothetical protein
MGRQHAFQTVKSPPGLKLSSRAAKVSLTMRS